jgi:membrane-associated PAP2 superfamily phosphatase
MKMSSDQSVALTTLCLLALLIGWDLSGLDLPLAQLFGGPEGFALREDWWLTTVMHEGARTLSWLLVLALCLGVWWPWLWLRRIAQAQRLQLVVSALLGALLVSLLKGLSATSCPWDLAEFGGLARLMPHWAGFFVTDGGSGHCFPAGHDSSGFAFLGGYFAFRSREPVLAWRWLLTAVLAGLVLGLAQQLRGAHFMSHTLWSGALCWVAAWAVDGLWCRIGRHRAAAFWLGDSV